MQPDATIFLKSHVTFYKHKFFNIVNKERRSVECGLALSSFRFKVFQAINFATWIEKKSLWEKLSPLPVNVPWHECITTSFHSGAWLLSPDFTQHTLRLCNSEHLPNEGVKGDQLATDRFWDLIDYIIYYYFIIT